MTEKNTMDGFDALGEATGLNVVCNGLGLELSSEADAFVSAEKSTREFLDYVDSSNRAGMECPPDLGSSWVDVGKKAYQTLKTYCEFNGTRP